MVSPQLFFRISSTAGARIPDLFSCLIRIIPSFVDAHKCIVVGSMLVAIFVFLQLVSSFGIPYTSFQSFKNNIISSAEYVIEGQQVPFRKGGFSHATLGTKYLLGVGKADITGYVAKYEPACKAAF